MTKPSLGILTLYLNKKCQIEERHIYEQMIEAGQKIGLDVSVFTPQDVEHTTSKVNAMVFHSRSGMWLRKRIPMPNLIFDRCRNQRSAQFSSMIRFRTHYGKLTYLNNPIGNKWAVHKLLSHSNELKRILPETILYKEDMDINGILKKMNMLYVKPVNGTGGRGILRLELSSNRPGYVTIEGRDQYRRVIRPQSVRSNELKEYMKHYHHKDQYLVQKGIPLRLSDGRVHDCRMLVQKDEHGEWKVTGSVGRVGAEHSVTSNLHGGGRAVPMKRLLTKWIGSSKQIEAIKYKIEHDGIRIAKYLEHKYGALCELALDWAIDKEGYHWLLEVNPKPSREVFKGIGDKYTYHKAIVQPIRYASWLANKKGIK